MREYAQKIYTRAADRNAKAAATPPNGVPKCSSGCRTKWRCKKNGTRIYPIAPINERRETFILIMPFQVLSASRFFKRLGFYFSSVTLSAPLRGFYV